MLDLARAATDDQTRAEDVPSQWGVGWFHFNCGSSMGACRTQGLISVKARPHHG
jgi:hypothetical protein